MRVNLLLAFASLTFALGGLEVWLRLNPPPPDIQTNNEYHFRERTGEKQFRVPYHSWQERFPEDLDERGYFAQADYTVGYYFNQFGARWGEAADQPLEGRVFLVLGDSFTYGSAVRYEDTWVQGLQDRLREAGHNVTLVNFGRSGANAEGCLEVYRTVSERLPYDAVLYALNVNDLVSFRTNYVIRNSALGWPFAERSALASFVFKRINTEIGRRYKLARITSPSVFEKRKFLENMAAIEALDAEVRAAGKTLYVALLPVLIDLHRESFRPIYDRIGARLAERGIEMLDTTDAVRGLRDSDLWVLPVDQHPNEIASALIAERLQELLGFATTAR